MISDEYPDKRTTRMSSSPVPESQTTFFSEFFPSQTPNKVLQIGDTFEKSVAEYFAKDCVVGNA